MCSLCRLPVAKNHNFGQILTFEGLLYRPLLPMRATFSVLEQTHGVRLHNKCRLDLFILSPSGGEKPQFLPSFGQRHLVVLPIGSNLRTLNTVAQLQTFRHQAVSESFLYTNAFVTKSCRMPCSNAANIERIRRKVNFAAGKIPLGGKSPRKCIYSVPAQKTAKHRAKFG